MQIKFFTVPIIGGESQTADLNLFLRSKKVLQTEHHLVTLPTGAYWCFCVKYLDEQLEGHAAKKIDYREVLDEATFQKFSKLREIRKQLAVNEAIPAYAIFTDEELAELARQEVITAATMKGVKGIGEKKVEKYGPHFFTKPSHEKG
jgi:superfamily II DNA helicase RecQ